MEHTLITTLQPLLGGIKGYLIAKPERGSYPAFTVEASERRGVDVHNNEGKPFGYTFDIQINILSRKWDEIRSLRKVVINHLDGFTGHLGDFDVTTCELVEATTGMSLNQNYESVLFFTLDTK